MNFKLLLIISLLATQLQSQTKLIGKILNDEGNPVSFAMLKVTDQAIGAKSNADGDYVLNLPAAGTYAIEASFIGYAKESFSITIKENEQINKDITLVKSNKVIKTVVVQSYRNKGGEAAILTEQKNAVIIEDKIGSAEMAKTGATDASAAVSKISGVTKSEGGTSGSTFVRGLGDRYISTTLNGLLLPSESSELKNISLNFFPTDIIQTIGVSKTFNQNVLGDFGGAAINISTKEYTGDPFVKLNFGAGVNSQAYDATIKKVGMDWLGKPTNANFYTNELNDYKFDNVNWNFTELSVPHIANSMAISSGLRKKMKNSAVGLFGTYSYSTDYSYREGLTGNLNSSGQFLQKYNKKTSTQTVNRVGMINGYWNTIKGHELKLVYLNIANSEDEVNSYYGRNTDINPDANTLISRGLQTVNNLNVFQVHSKFKYSDKIEFHANSAFNIIDSKLPQRVQNIMIESRPNEFRLSSNSAANNNLYWQNMNELQGQLKMGAKIDLAKNSDKLSKLYVGINYITKHKDFVSNQYNFKPLVTPIGEYNINTLNNFFNRDNYNSNLFEISFFRGGNLPNSYNGSISNYGGVIDYEMTMNPKTTLSFGLKAEYIDQTVSWDVSPLAAKTPKGTSSIGGFKPLPYVNVKHSINDKTNLKGGLSKTYTLPQFKEIAPFLYEDVVSNSYGNPYLYASDNYNFDLKLEKFPSSTELISIGFFGKYIANPINKTLAPNSANEMTYANTGNYAIATGLELEIRKNINTLLNIKSQTHNLSTGINLAYIYSLQELNDSKILKESKGFVSGNFTTQSAALTGASPIIVNADISYSGKFKSYEPTITLVGNYAMDKVYSLGLFGIGNSYEKGYVSLDLITRHNLGKNIGLSFGIRNILNPSIETYQVLENSEKVVNSSYKRGINTSLSISYNFK